MKKYFVFIFLTAIIYCNSNAQFTPGQVELGAYMALGNDKSEVSYMDYSNNDSRDYFMFSVLPGFYVADGLSFEPEIDIISYEKIKPAFIFLLDAAYTYRIPKTMLAPFARIGYGISNSYGYPNTMFMGRTSNAMDIHIFNAGIGMKFLVTNNVLLKAEFNYRSFKPVNSESAELEKFKTLLFGFSILFN